MNHELLTGSFVPPDDALNQLIRVLLVEHRTYQCLARFGPYFLIQSPAFMIVLDEVLVADL